MAKNSRFPTVKCAACGARTTPRHADQHDGLCAACVRGAADRRQDRQGRLIDHGHDACQRESGAYDLPDWA